MMPGPVLACYSASSLGSSCTPGDPCPRPAHHCGPHNPSLVMHCMHPPQASSTAQSGYLTTLAVVINKVLIKLNHDVSIKLLTPAVAVVVVATMAVPP